MLHFLLAPALSTLHPYDFFIHLLFDVAKSEKCYSTFMTNVINELRGRIKT